MAKVPSLHDQVATADGHAVGYEGLYKTSHDQCLYLQGWALPYIASYPQEADPEGWAQRARARIRLLGKWWGRIAAATSSSRLEPIRSTLAPVAGAMGRAEIALVLASQAQRYHVVGLERIEGGGS